jgi:hypothetical protein
MCSDCGVRAGDGALPVGRKLTPAWRIKVTELRQEGAKLQYAGKHNAAEVSLEKAKAILASAR